MDTQQFLHCLVGGGGENRLLGNYLHFKEGHILTARKLLANRQILLFSFSGIAVSINNCDMPFVFKILFGCHLSTNIRPVSWVL